MTATTSAQNILKSARLSASGEIPEAFWEVIERYRGELVNQALAIVGNLADAEDVVQETFCEVYRDGQRLAELRSLGAWLRAVNRAHALNRLRARRRDSQRLGRKQREAPERTATTGGFNLLELREAVAKAIEALPEELRAVVVLRFWEDRSHAEIAERLGIPQGTVWKRLCEASEHLFPKLNAYLQAPVPARPETEGAPEAEAGGSATNREEGMS